MTILPYLTTVVFVLLLNPALYVLYTHGWHGLLGYFYITAFCIVRILGGAFQIVAEQDPDNGHEFENWKRVEIFNAIGLAPLILAGVGILHEARIARLPDPNKKLEWFFQFLYHTVLSAAMATIVTAMTKIFDGNPNNTNTTQNSLSIKIGMAVIFVCWGVLVMWTLVSLREPGGAAVDSLRFADGTQLLQALIMTMPFILTKLVYGVCTFFIVDQAFANSEVAKAFLSFVPEVLATTTLLWAGFQTRNIWRRKEGKRRSIGLISKDANGFYPLASVASSRTDVEQVEAVQALEVGAWRNVKV